MVSGNRKNYIYTYRFEGVSGVSDIQLVMKMFRCGFKTIGGIGVDDVLDHGNRVSGYPEADPESIFLEYRLAGGSSVELIAYCDEPVLEVRITVTDDYTENAAAEEGMERAPVIVQRIREDLENIIYMDRRMGYCCE